MSLSLLCGDIIISDLQELGMDCVAWNPSVYHDLLRSGDGTAEGIVAAYFGMVRSQVPSDTPVEGCCTFLTSQVCKWLGGWTSG